MLRPLLIIGVGGSGGKTIRSMIQSLERKFTSLGYDGPIPAAWQFLQIDTTYDGVDFPAPMLDKDNFHGVVAEGDNFTGILRSINGRGNVSEQQKMMAGWGIPYSAVNVGDGAGQTRAIGRQVGVADAQGILGAIQNSISKMNSPTAFAELVNLAGSLNLSTPSKTPQAFLIASVAGGSGAGMCMDVAELLKRANAGNWTSSCISFLYTAEVFTSVGKGAKDTAKNSLGAFNEIMAGKWVGLSDRSEFFYQKLGLPPVAQIQSAQFGPVGNFLVGARNKQGTDISIGADGAGMNEVFLTIGEALAGVITDDEISGWLYQQAIVNVTQTRSAIDGSGLAPISAENPTLAAAGIGFGQLSLGSDRLMDYVADALTKVQVEKLLWPDMTLDLLKNGVTTQTRIEERANQLWPNFLVESNLDEKGSQDQIINALFPQGWETEVRGFAKKVASTSVGDKPMPLANYARNVYAEWETESEKFAKTIQDKINSNAKAWVPSIQEHVKNQIAAQITNEGYSVVLNLMERLKKELANYSLPELLREGKEKAAAVYKPNQGEFLLLVQDKASGLTGIGIQNAEFLSKIEKELARSVAYQVISHVNELGASLIQDLLRNFIDPVTRSIVEARRVLDKEQAADKLESGKKNPFLNFPKWGSGVIDQRYRPRTIERILIDVTDYEKTYELYAQRDSGGTPPFQASVTQSLLGKKMNPKDGDPNQQTLIETRIPWTTGVREAKDGMGTVEAKAAWHFKTSLENLGDRNRKWLQDRDSSFGKFTTMSIRSFLEAEGLDGNIKDQREKKFVSEFQSMLALAHPLVLLNDEGMRYVKGVGGGTQADGVLLKSSRLPVDPNSSVGRDCITVLNANGQNSADGSFLATWFNAASNATTLYAASTTQASLPAWAFASLTEPILEQVATSKNDSNLWIQFWEGRRARPLVEAVPFETEIRRSIVTGWFIASIFGLREIEVHANGRAVKVWNPTLQTPGYSLFPDPLLNTHSEDAARGNWMLPAILMSAGIALSEFGKTGNMEKINAYKFLLFLGREVTTGIKNRDEWNLPGSGDELPNGDREMCKILRTWVMEGTKPSKNDLLEMLTSRLTPGDNRAEALKATLLELSEQYKHAWDEFKLSYWSEMPETWELKDDIDLALHDIHNYVAGLHTITARTGA